MRRILYVNMLILLLVHALVGAELVGPVSLVSMAVNASSEQEVPEASESDREILPAAQTLRLRRRLAVALSAPSSLALALQDGKILAQSLAASTRRYLSKTARQFTFRLFQRANGIGVPLRN